MPIETLGSLRPSRALWSNFSLNTLWTLRAYRSLGPGCTRRSGRSGITFRSLCSSCSCRPLRSLRAGFTLWTWRTLLTHRALQLNVQLSFVARLRVLLAVECDTRHGGRRRVNGVRDEREAIVRQTIGPLAVVAEPLLDE